VDGKSFRFDLIVALGALLISSVAAASSAYQTYVIRKQFSATVWPYVTFVTSSSTDRYFELDVSNPGIGPALIYSAVVTRDGKAVQRVPSPTTLPAIDVAIASERAAAKSDEERSGEHKRPNITVSTIYSGDILPAGAKLDLLRVEGKYITRRVLANIRRVDLTVCYCSLLGDCWTKRLWDPAIRPHPVHACPNA
jgi:hypothetical protein